MDPKEARIFDRLGCLGKSSTLTLLLDGCYWFTADIWTTSTVLDILDIRLFNLCKQSTFQYALAVTLEQTWIKPGDKLKGTANLFSVDPIQLRSVKVICSAVCRVFTFDGQKKPVKDALEVLFTKSMVVHDGKKQSSLPSGVHKWNYFCTLPSSNQLPPSFDYRDQDGTAEVMYVVVMRLEGDNLSPEQSRCYLKFKYAPRRLSCINPDESLSKLSELLLVKQMEDEDIRGWKRGVPGILRRRVFRRDMKDRCYRITMLLPHCAAFSEHMDINVKVENVSEDQDSNSDMAFDLSLAEVEYQLWAFTRVAFNKTSRSQQHLVQHESNVSVSSLSANGLWVSLRRRAPFRVQPRLYGTPFDKTSFSTIGPSFGTQNIVREYRLNIVLLVLAWGETYRVSFEDNDLIVLPHESQLS